MKECTEVKKLLVAYSAKELSDTETNRVRDHINRCPSCLEEYNKIRDVFGGIEKLRDENTTVIKETDWIKRAQELGDLLIRYPKIIKKSFSSVFSGWRILAPVLASIFFLGLMLGYFLFHSEPTIKKDSFESGIADLSFTRIESTLAKKGVLEFFKQTQLLLTELMNKCDNETVVFLNKKMKEEQIRSLLLKSRYFSHDLHDPELLSSRNLLT
ncbi:MAG: zf-HC2 domain-containing protein, partial [Candidatus Aminicenantes bacterium]|nr:zf-HC2 domain-containing protein [Candidatus Aminicenantes bacterium]